MRARLAGVGGGVLLLVGSLGLPIAPQLGGQNGPLSVPPVGAAESFTPDGRILVGGGGVFAGARTCSPDCHIAELTPSLPNDTDAAWSPTGRLVAFSRQVGDAYLLHVLDITTGAVTLVTSVQGVATSDSDPDWSPDGSRIAFTHITDSSEGVHTIQIGIVSLLGGAPASVYYLPPVTGDDDPCKVFEPARFDPTFSPDGQHIAYVAALTNAVVFANRPQTGHDVALVSFGGAQPPATAAGSCPLLDVGLDGGVYSSSTDTHEGERRVAPTLGRTSAPAWSPDGAKIALVSKDGPYVVPVGGGTPIAIRDSAGNRPHPIDAPGSFTGFHTGWDPGMQFVLVYDPLSNMPAVKYKPDGSGDLDTPNGTHATGGWSAQCVPSNCLTALTVRVRVDGAEGRYPSTFHLSGTVSGDLIVDADLHEQTRFVKIKPGHAAVTMAPNADWPLSSITCDAPATVNVAAGRVDLEIPLGRAVTCEFLSDIGTSIPTEMPTAGPTDPGQLCDAVDTTYTAQLLSSPGNPDLFSFEVLVNWCHFGTTAKVVQESSYATGEIVWPPYQAYLWNIVGISLQYEGEPLQSETLPDGSVETTATGKFSACYLPIPGGVGGLSTVLGKIFGVIASHLPQSVKSRLVKALTAVLAKALTALGSFLDVHLIIDTLVDKATDTAMDHAGFSGCFFPMWYANVQQRFYPDGHVDPPIDNGTPGTGVTVTGPR